MTTNGHNINGKLENVQNGHKNKMQNHTETDNNKSTYETLVQSAEFLKKLVPFEPQIGIICGSGMGSLADGLQDKIEVPYESIPHFPRSTVKGHAGALVFGHLSGVPVVCMKGRFHYYEGYPLWKCSMPVRVMKLLGATHLIATNAAGGLNAAYRVGDVVLVKDHINLMGFAGNNPLQGPNEERFGPRFPPMNQAYDRELLAAAKAIAKEAGLPVHEGVYTCLGGPNFETVAELRMLSMLGADTVGMSTVHEVITARHCDMTVLAFSLVTNECITDYECRDNPDHQEVIDVGKMREGPLRRFVGRVVEHIGNQ